MHSIVASKTHALFWSTIISAVLVLSGCGGGGGGGNNTTSNNNGGGNVVAPATGSVGIAAAAANVLPMTVGGGLTSTPNLPTVSVTVCTPGTTQCQTVDNIQVDTGSSGLRILASALTSPTGFPQVSVSNAPLSECQVFADGFTWGSVRTADIKLSGESALATPVQLIGDSTSSIPTACSNKGANIGSVSGIGVNGILGVGVMPQDCGSACVTAGTSLPQMYFTCTGGTCTAATVPLTQQIPNPVTKFAADNNGVILQLPGVPVGGTPAVTGALVFGIGTANNNALASSAKIFGLDSLGNFSTSFNGTSYTQSFLDSGSNGLFFNDANLPVCASTSSAPGFYCPTSAMSFNAVMTSSTNAATGTVAFTVSNAATLATTIQSPTNNRAFSDLAGGAVLAKSFDWGLPFFFGRSVYTAIRGASTSGGTGPYIAY